MPRPRPPSYIDAVPTPLFGIGWYGDPGDGTSIVAYCGGGGSAATGVKNLITVQIAGEEDLTISTDDQIGVAIAIVKNPLTNKIRMFVPLASKVHVYSLPSGTLDDEVSVGDNVNAIAVNSMADRLAVGCESGTVKVFKIENDKIDSIPQFTLEGHTKAVCSLDFSPKQDKLVSSAKDGTARVWSQGRSLGVLTCSIDDPRAPAPKRKPQCLVRGCAFGDMDGNLIYTVASGRKGKAFLSRWGFNENQYTCLLRTACSPCPISAMSLSGDGGLMSLGSVDGTIILWGIEQWKPIKTFDEVHDLPVTCTAARPYPVPLRCDENGVQMHALSASADSQMAWLTSQKPPRAHRPSDDSFKSRINSMLKLAVLACVLYPLGCEVWDHCGDHIQRGGLGAAVECIHHDVLIAPSNRAGIVVPPY